MAREDPGPQPGPDPADPAYDPTPRPGEPVTSGAETEVVSHFSPARRAYEAIYLVFAAICALLILRIVLKLLAANTAVAFTGFVYGVTDVLMGPFRGLLPVMTSGRTIFELSAIVALFVYALVGYLLARLVALLFMRDVTVAHSRRGRYRTY
jgi:YggT family protein